MLTLTYGTPLNPPGPQSAGWWMLGFVVQKRVKLPKLCLPGHSLPISEKGSPPRTQARSPAQKRPLDRVPSTQKGPPQMPHSALVTAPDLPRAGGSSPLGPSPASPWVALSPPLFTLSYLPTETFMAPQLATQLREPGKRLPLRQGAKNPSAPEMTHDNEEISAMWRRVPPAASLSRLPAQGSRLFCRSEGAIGGSFLRMRTLVFWG